MEENVYLEEIAYSKYKIESDTFRIVEIDDGFEKILGFTREDIATGELYLQSIMFEEDWEDYVAMTKEILARKNEAYIGHRLKRKDGSCVFVFCFGKCLLPDENGKLYSEILITDITNTRGLQRQVETLSGINSKLTADLKDNNKMLEATLNNLAGGVGVFEYQRNKLRAQFVSDSFYRMLKVEKEYIDSCRDDIALLFVPDDKKAFRKQIQETILTNRSTVGVYRFSENGSDGLIWVQVCLSVMSIKKGTFLLCAVFTDITSEKKAELENNAQAELVKLVVEGTNEFMFSYEVDSDRMTISKYEEGRMIVLYDKEGFQSDISCCRLLHFEDRDAMYNLLNSMISIRGKRSMEFQFDFDGDGQYKWYRILLVSVADTNDDVRKIVGKIYSIHEEKLKRQKLLLMAEQDSLTKIYNHSTFKTKAEVMLKNYKNRICSFYMLDIDDFKLVNDALGHYEGDELLRLTASVIDGIARKNGGFAGRLGGDEFALFIPDMKNEAEAIKIAENMKHAVSEIKCKIAHYISIGLTTAVIEDDNCFDKLYYQADQALYAAKRQGKNRYMTYEDSMKKAEKANSGGVSESFEESSSLLEYCKDIVYIADVNTHELCYMNKAAKRILDIPEDDTSYIGKPCYEVFHGLEGVCEFCTNDFLSGAKSYVWHHQNAKDGNEYIFKDNLIDWRGRKCRLTTAVAASSIDNVTRALSERYDMEDALTSSILHMVKNKEYSLRYQELLETIGSYYGAKHCCMVENGAIGKGEYYEWKSANSSELGDTLKIFSDKNVLEYIKDGLHENGTFVIKNTAKLSKDDSPLYSFFMNNRIWSVYAVAIQEAEVYIGMILVFNVQNHSGDLNLLNIMAQYIGTDIQRRKLMEARTYELTHDRITNVCNRNAYVEYLNNTRLEQAVGLVYIDINDARSIYDDFGQAFVDNLVVEFVTCMKETFPMGRIFRTGEDDFIIICEGISKADFLDRVEIIKSRLKSGEFTACVGYVWDDFEKELKKMERHAYDMLYMEKQKYYDRKNEHSYKWNTLNRELVKKDLKNNMFSIRLQPKVDFSTERIYGAEALVRYAKKDHLASVIDRLEKSRTIKYMDIFVLEKVCEVLVSWRKKDIPLIPISCNFSRVSLLEEGMPEMINSIVEKYNVPKEMIEIEITESIGELEHEMVARIANKLHASGFRIAMDDFGTKYSNVSILANVNFDVIKLDRSMVYNIDYNDISRKILKHLVQMCTELGVECIAEGVENKKQAEYLQGMGCHYIQGFFYSKPVDIDTFEEMYQENIRR